MQSIVMMNYPESLISYNLLYTNGAYHLVAP